MQKTAVCRAPEFPPYNFAENRHSWIENNIDIKNIEILSNLESVEIESLKVIYDRINLLSKVDWDRFIALAEQTKSADYLEISNLKHINNLVRKKDKNIGEINIRKAHELLIKLSTKFKIKY